MSAIPDIEEFMKIIIYRKANPSGQPEIYDFDQSEFTKLAQDFESFLKTGMPQQGVYWHNTEHEASSTLRLRKNILLRFDEISAIG